MGKVTDGDVTVVNEEEPKKPKGKVGKFLGNFFHGDFKSIKNYIFTDVKKVAIDDAMKILADAGKGAVDRIIYGASEEAPTSNSTVRSVNYQGAFGSKSGQRSTPQPKFGSLVLDSVDDCQKILKNLQGIIDRCGVVTVLQMYDMAGYYTDMHTANKYGWTSIGSAKIIKGDIGWKLEMPTPMPLD